MRFVSQYKMFGIQVRPIREMVLATGQIQVQVEPIYVRFWQGDITEAEVAAAEAHWREFAGRTVERDMMTPTSILARLSTFDTSAAHFDWSDEERAMVEEFLQAKAGGQDFIYVPAPVIAPPWPTYDSFGGNLNDLLARINEDGYTLESVLAYEESDGPQRQAHIYFLREEILKRDAVEAQGDFIPA